MSISSRLQKWWRSAKDVWAFSSIMNAHRSLGHPFPAQAAHQELQIRGEIERFRDFATDEILANPATPMALIAKHWIKANVIWSKIPEIKDRNMQLKNVILGMTPEETLHEDGLKLFKQYEARVFSQDVATEIKRDPTRARNTLGLNRHELRALRGLDS